MILLHSRQSQGELPLTCPGLMKEKSNMLFDSDQYFDTNFYVVTDKQ